MTGSSSPQVHLLQLDDHTYVEVTKIAGITEMDAAGYVKRSVTRILLEGGLQLRVEMPIEDVMTRIASYNTMADEKRRGW